MSSHALDALDARVFDDPGRHLAEPRILDSGFLRDLLPLSAVRVEITHDEFVEIGMYVGTVGHRFTIHAVDSLRSSTARLLQLSRRRNRIIMRIRARHSARRHMYSVPMDSYDVLRENILALLRTRGWTKNEFAKLAGVASRSVSSVCGARPHPTYTPTLELLERLAAPFGIPPWLLLVPDLGQHPSAIPVLADLCSTCLTLDPEGLAQLQRVAAAEHRYAASRRPTA